VAARDNGHTDAQARASAIDCVRAYREHLRDYSKMNPLEVWYDRLDEQRLIAMAPDAEARERRKEYAARAHQRVGEYLLPRISEEVGGRRRLLDQPPILFHVDEKDIMKRAREAVDLYRLSLSDPVRVLFDRYRLEDLAVKVVGIGSVGTRCLVGLFFSAENHPLLLQFKEACPSVLAPYAGESVYQNQGQRVVVGQRLMQCSSDLFLGWTRGRRGYDYFGRQLRDMKFSFPVEGAAPKGLLRYAELCGWTLARAHAKSGDAAAISGYLGKTGNREGAVRECARADADQTVGDHAALVTGVKTGRVKARVEENL